VTLLSHCCHTLVTLLSHCCYTVVTRLLHCCFVTLFILYNTGECPPESLRMLRQCKPGNARRFDVHTHYCYTVTIPPPTPHPHPPPLPYPCCYTVVTLLSHCCHTVAEESLRMLRQCEPGNARCFDVHTLLLHCRYTVVTPWLHWSYTIVTNPSTPPYSCCYTVVEEFLRMLRQCRPGNARRYDVRD
jgi:hypothetical protein